MSKYSSLLEIHRDASLNSTDKGAITLSRPNSLSFVLQRFLLELLLTEMFKAGNSF